VQYLQEETRHKILSVALREFAARGYKDASMRQIAAKAEMTVGNIYRYYDNKAALFDALVRPAWEQLKSVIVIDKRIGSAGGMTPHNLPVAQIAQEIIRLARDYGQKFYILLFKSEGSPYQSAYDRLIQRIAERFEQELFPLVPVEARDRFLPELLAKTIVDGFFTIMDTCGDDPTRMEKLFGQLLGIMLKDVDQRMKG